MAHTVSALGRNDLKGIRRESLFAFVVFAPLGWIAMVRFGTPPATDLVAERYGVDLVPYYPVILTGFLLLTSPTVIGMLGAFLVLDERDGGTIAALRVTPTRMSSYLGYRAATVIVITTIYVLLTMPASGLLPLDQVAPLIAVGLVAGLSGVIISLTLVAFARNKVEGLAVARAIGIVVAGLPLIPYFLGPEWQYPFWVLPTYWPAKAYWLISTGDVWWPYIVGGVIYQLPLIWLLYRRFIRSLG